MLNIEYIRVCPSGLKNGSAELGREFRVFGGEIGPQTLSGRGRKTISAMALPSGHIQDRDIIYILKNDTSIGYKYIWLKYMENSNYLKA